MTPLATIAEVAEAAPIGFVIGLVVGFVLANRFRITRRD
jgi:uncharacterized membrane-anchored protein YhcB (DUF1043 family)